MRPRGGRGGVLVLALVAFLVATGFSEAGQVRADVPETVDPHARYLIFIQGPAPGEAVANAFAGRGFEVVTERRNPNPDPFDLARKATGQVRRLLLGGISASRIGIMGFDVGGTAALVAAALLRDAELSYVVLAGCGIDDRYYRFATQLADQMAGRALHLWEKTDQQAESCQLAFSKSKTLESDEKLLSNGGGHEMFGEADPFWMDLVLAFLERR
ncbi:MAG: hypothetical protein EXQ95_03645 [Alphaproteobacteria bacterium]|nr:hypothetical protein [Alphaproteobacteria bacterium]